MMRKLRPADAAADAGIARVEHAALIILVGAQRIGGRQAHSKDTRVLSSVFGFVKWRQRLP